MSYFAAVRRCTLLTLGMLVGGVVGASAQQVMMMQGAGSGIEVSGVGEVEVAPDEATLNFAVETSAPTSQEAAQQNATQMERVIAALVAAGIPRNEIETRNFNVYPEYVTDERGENPRVRGYRVSNHVSFETTRLEAVGSLIDAGLAAGANRIDGVSFGLRNPAAAEAEALREAVERARASAETLAQALGVTLGQLVHATTSTDPIRPIPLMAMNVRTEAAQAFDTPIQPGQQMVQARVVLLFSIVR
jgi:uncharacterized protein